MKTRTIIARMSAAAMLLLAGCGEKKCFFVAQDGSALREGAPVVWYDAYVGKVDSVADAEGGAKVTVRLDGKYEGEIHDGVAGRVVNDPGILPSAFVLLVGGRDKDRPLLDDGAQIPESRQTGAVREGFSAFVDWLRNSRADELKVIAVAILLLVVLVKFVGKMLKLAILVGIALAVCYVCVTANIGWSGYRERLENARGAAQEARSWLQQHGDKLRVVLETALESGD